MPDLSMDNLEHDSNEDAILPPGVTLEQSLSDESQIPPPPTPLGATGHVAPPPPEPGPIARQRQEMRERAKIGDGDEWLRPENPYIWTGDVVDDDDLESL